MNEFVAHDAADDPERPLREDIRLLGRVLGDTLREQEGEAAFALIEHIRQTAIRFRRDRDPQAKRELEDSLDRLDPDRVTAVARAFTFFSLLANIAEDQHHNRTLRTQRMTASPPERGRNWPEPGLAFKCPSAMITSPRRSTVCGQPFTFRPANGV